MQEFPADMAVGRPDIFRVFGQAAEKAIRLLATGDKRVGFGVDMAIEHVFGGAGQLVDDVEHVRAGRLSGACRVQLCDHCPVIPDTRIGILRPVAPGNIICCACFGDDLIVHELPHPPGK